MIEIGRYALIVGNSQYDDKALQQLVTPGQDIEALEDVLKNPAIGNFKVEVRRDIENRKLHSDIGQFLTEGRKSTDTLLLYFSGHGVVNAYSGQLYLAVKDSVRDRLGSTAIPTRFIYDCIQESPAGSKIIILDCCYSGAMTTIMLAKSPPKVTLAREFEGKGIVFLSASTAWQYAFQETDVKKLSENTLSLFTRFLVQGLKTGEADRDGDGVITIRELYDYILENVRKETSNQTPEISSIDQQGDIVIANSVRSRSDDSLKKPQRHAMQGVKRQNQTLDSVEGTYQHALDHYRNKDWAEAEQWFSVVVKEDPDYKDAASLLAETKKQLKLKAIYSQGQQALEAKDWKAARDRFQEVLNIDPDYEKAQELHDIAHKEVELPSLYSLTLEKCENREWDQAVKALQDIRNLDPRYRAEEISRLLDQARKKKKLDQDYEWALDQYEDAEKTRREEDWKKVVGLLEQIVHADPSYKTVAFDVKLEYARKKARYLEFSRQIREHFAKQEWRRILERSRQASDLVPQGDLAVMVAEAKEKLNGQEMKKRQSLGHCRNYLCHRSSDISRPICSSWA
jgi:tetratricopeptide (TPR) repeat protein